MNELDWLIKEIRDYQINVTTYEEKAFFQELETIVNEQLKRIRQAEGELDGSLWSPKKW